MGRSRLSPEERRTQLLDLGAELFASMPYDEVHIERVAEQAGVSRGLLYHYFPTKRAFFAELVRRGTVRMAADTEPDPDRGPVEQLAHGVERYLDHVRRNQHGSRAVQRGAASGDAEVQEIIADSQHLFETRILDVLAPEGHAGPGGELVGVAVRSWILMMRAAGQELLDHPDLAVDDVRDLCVSSFIAMMLALPADRRPSRVAELAAVWTS